MHAELLDYGGLSLTFTEYSANFPFPPTVAAWSELTLRTSMSPGPERRGFDHFFATSPRLSLHNESASCCCFACSAPHSDAEMRK